MDNVLIHISIIMLMKSIFMKNIQRPSDEEVYMQKNV